MTDTSDVTIDLRGRLSVRPPGRKLRVRGIPACQIVARIREEVGCRVSEPYPVLLCRPSGHGRWRWAALPDVRVVARQLRSLGSGSIRRNRERKNLLKRVFSISMLALAGLITAAASAQATCTFHIITRYHYLDNNGSDHACVVWQSTDCSITTACAG